MQLNNSDDIFKKIKQDTSKSDEEIQALIIKIKDKYQGLLSDVGANIMIAKQLNVDLDIKSTSSTVKISELTTSLDNVNIYARIKFIPPLKLYKAKDGSQGKIQSVFVKDDSGETKLNLWQEKADIVSELKLDKNDLICIKDAYVTSYNDKLELSLRHGGSIIKNPDDAPNIEKLKDKYLNVSDIEEATDDLVSTIGRIINIFPINTFETKDGVSKKVLNFELSDGIKTIKCVAWEPWADVINKDFSKGDVIKLSDIRVKEGLYDLELYINWNSCVLKNPKTTIKIPPLSEIVATSTEIQESKIESLEDGKNYLIDGLIISVNRNNLRYFKCPKCNEKVQLINNDFICEKCNDVVEPDVNLFGSIDIDDGTGMLKVVFFKDAVEKIFNITKEQVGKDLSDDEKTQIFDKLDESLLGKKVKITGRAKLNGFSSQIELLANSVDFVD